MPTVRPATIIVPALAALGAACPAMATTLDDLAQGQRLHGFEATARYLGPGSRPMGAGFRHLASGAEVHLLRIESAPQSFLWFQTIPDSDRGEPHTQEHLLLGKGNAGRAVAGREAMTLASSSAFTDQWRTCYHAHAVTGVGPFFELLEAQLGALLRPDYGDEEIRREVRNFGVARDPDGTLRLEEKGTVYNEMVSTYGNPYTRLFRELGLLLYGSGHPLSFDSGGLPEAIREMKPEHIRAFHARAYRLENLGLILALPSEVELADALAKVDGILGRQRRGDDRPLAPATEASIPPAAPAEAGTLRIVEYPSDDDAAPGHVALSWPPVRHLGPEDYFLLGQFLANMASDATTNLYKAFIDGQSRVMDLGARDVGAWAGSDRGMAVTVLFSDVPATRLAEATLREVRDRVLAEMRAVAGMADGSAELTAFNERLRSRLIQERRAQRKLAGSPPGFGFRGTGSEWMERLRILGWHDAFDRSVALEPEIAHAEALLTGKGNPWRAAVARWKLTDVPFVVAVRGSSSLLAAERQARSARIAAETERLVALYGAPDAQAAIRRYEQEYDATTRELQSREEALAGVPLATPLPMTLDDGLRFESKALEGVPRVAVTVDGMPGAAIGLALSLQGVDDADLPYLSILPEILTSIGVVKDGVAVSHEEMSEALKREVLSLSASFRTDLPSGRSELVLRGSGTDMAETARAAAWMELVLRSADLRPENLPRIRDVVAQTLAGLRSRLQWPEEAWVRDPARAYRGQGSRLFLSVDSFLTQTHHAHRLKWELTPPPRAGAGSGIAALLEDLAALQASRPDIEALLAAVTRGGEAPVALRPLHDRVAALPEEERALAREAAQDVAAALQGVPDGSFAADFAYLCRQVRRDLLQEPSVALARLDRLRSSLATRARARLFTVATAPDAAPVAAAARALLRSLSPVPSPPIRPAGVATRHVDARLAARTGGESSPLFVGLVVPSLSGGVFVNSAPLAGYRDADAASVKRVLCGAIMAGHGAHGAFMKTWAAGLAYSNGFRPSLREGHLVYYAERTPELPQTLAFVIEQVKAAPRRPGLVDYALAQVFGDSRVAADHEERAAAMAEDLADGITPDVVRRFREAALAQRKDPRLLDALFDLMPEVYGRVLPGYGTPSAKVDGGQFFVIGPDSQLDRYASYLRDVEGESARLHRLHPRDYWITATLP